MNVEFNKRSVGKFFGTSNKILWGLLFAVTIIFTFFLYPSLVTPRFTYIEGDVAQRDIKAPKDFFVEDTEATEANRQIAVDSVLTIYDHDQSLAQNLIKNVDEAFAELRKALLPVEVTPEETKSPTQAKPTTGKLSQKERILQLRGEFEKKLGISVSDGAYKILHKEEFSIEISNLISRLLNKILSNGVVANKEILLREIDKGIILKTVGSEEEETVKNLKGFYSLDQAEAMVRIFAGPLFKGINYNVRNLIVDFTQRLLRPNITLNRSETENRVEKAKSEIKPTLYKIKAGEMLLREGERVTHLQLIKLKALEHENKSSNFATRGIGTSMVIFCILLTTYILYIKQNNSLPRDHNKNMFFVATVLVVFLLVAKLLSFMPHTGSLSSTYSIPISSVYFGIPLASGAMIVCMFMGISVALPFSLVMAVFTAVIFSNRFDIFIYVLLSSSMGAYWMQNCRERKVFIKAGAKLGAFNVLASTAVAVYSVNFSGPSIMWSWTFAFLGGIAAGIVTAGITPLVEIIFDYTTDIKLLELANLDRPILRRLMIEAPGTYNHSVIVGTMADAVASEIGANPLLARVCGYYHDIGKIKKPQYFIENQGNGKNRHDKLAPSMSALILTGHIKDGIEIAKEHRLGRAIVDAIKQHHGTSLISYFYEKAKQQKGEEGIVNEEDFRYPGPKPQTIEAALVMLADVVEAASRTLDNPTPARIQGLVHNLINKIFTDGQLDYCEITLKDLHKIAKSFNTILNGIYHHRIEYIDNKSSETGKSNNANTDNKRTDKDSTAGTDSTEKSTNGLKRLGIS